MRIAGKHGRAALCHLHRARRAGSGGQQPRLRADGHALHIAAADFKILVGQILVDPAHEGLPHRGGRVAACRDPCGRIVADPDRRRIIRRVADKITVVVAVGRAGLAGDGHAGKLCSRAGAAVHNVLEQLVDGIGRAFLHCNVRLRFVFQNGIAVVVPDLNIGTRHGVDAAVGKAGIGRRHLARCHALGKAAQRQRARCGDIIVGQRGEAQLFREERVGRRERELLDGAYCRGVRGVAHRIPQRHDAAVALIGVHRPHAVVHHLHGVIVDHARRRDHARVQRRRINAQRLDRRTALPNDHRIVKQEAALALAHAARNGHNVARCVVDDRCAGLELLALGGGVVKVAAVGIDALYDRLKLGIHRAVDRIAARVEHGLGNLFFIALLLHQIGDDVVEHPLDKVGVVGRVGRDLGHHGIARGKIVIPCENELLVLRLLILRIVKVAQLVHFVKHRKLALLILFAVPVAL